MEKRSITKSQHEFLSNELDFFVEQDLLPPAQKDSLLGLYEIKGGLNFVRIILLLGALLVGLGILSFIASNWQVMTKVSRFGLILISFVGFQMAGYKLTNPYPKLARSLTYISVFIYGAGIFLIGQMFNFGGHFTQAFLLWAVGILPLAFFTKDTLLHVFIHGLLLVYINGYAGLNQYPLVALVLCPLLYYGTTTIGNAPLLTFMNNLIAFNLLGYTLHYYHMAPELITLCFFGLGLVLHLIPPKFNPVIFKLQGILMLGIAGLILTFRDVWSDYAFANINIYFTLVFLALILALIRKGNLIALIFFCLTILRFYTDTFYDFMPKSLFFITGGVMLLGFGYYFEKQRQHQGGLGYEK